MRLSLNDPGAGNIRHTSVKLRWTMYGAMAGRDPMVDAEGCPGAERRMPHPAAGVVYAILET